MSLSKCECGEPLYGNDPPCHERCIHCHVLIPTDELISGLSICENCLVNEHEYFTIRVFDINDRFISMVQVDLDTVFVSTRTETPRDALKEAKGYCYASEMIDG